MTLRTASRTRLAAGVVAAFGALLISASPADAAPSCSRGGATILAASAKTRVVSIRNRPRNQETRRHHVFGCRVPTGRRFELFYSRDFGLDLIERDRFTIVEDRYIGALRTFEGGVSESRTATVYDAFTRRKLRDGGPCSQVDQGDFSGVDDAVFLPRGGLAYACGRLRIADAQGDRQLEPPGTDVRHLAVSLNSRGFHSRLYWTVFVGPTQTAKALDLGF
jgi:hypothetical protein